MLGGLCNRKVKVLARSAQKMNVPTIEIRAVAINPFVLLAGVSLLLAQLACPQPTPIGPAATQTVPVTLFADTAEPIEPVDTPTLEPATATPEAPKTTEVGGQAQSPAVPGMACFGSGGYGVTCLDEEGWHVYTREDSPLGGDYIKSIAVCPDNQLLIAHTSGINVFDGETWKEYEQEWGHSSVETIACDTAGTIWVAHFRGVSHFDGTSWITYPSKQLATGAAATDLVEDVVVAPDGRVWVTTANSVATFDGDEWTIYQQGQGFEDRYFFDRVTIDDHGRPWAAHSSGILAFEGGAWTPHPKRDLYTVKSLAVDAQGRVWVGTSKGVHVLQDGAWTTYDRTNSELEANQVRVIATDTQDRVWLGTEWGLYVVDGIDWHIYRIDNADLRDNDIRAMAVVEGGPPLPEPMDKAPGSLGGQVVLKDGEPAAGATVEICIERMGSRFLGETPCSDQAFMRRTETDADGAFVFPDLPAGLYVVTINIGEDWTQLTGDLGFVSERVSVESGEETDLGELIVGEEE
jgi:hypothetical protein